ncbi:hypothetical protein KTN05_10655, partial [Paracoccus sp. Z118]|uniref:hypothetical protein n=1 Tax=Paracoccus sp. Z118 TaxID=2851017 RepID=UPI001C2BC9C2
SPKPTPSRHAHPRRMDRSDQQRQEESAVALTDEVVLLFDQLCGARLHEHSRMGRIIGATSSFNVKIDLATEAAESFLENERQRAAVIGWIRLCKKAAEIRNKIAHGTPTNLHHVSDGTSRQGFFLAPSIYDTKKNQFLRTGEFGGDSRYCWNSYQLHDYVRAFFILRSMLQTLREELAGASEEPMPQVLDPDAMIRRR